MKIQIEQSALLSALEACLWAVERKGELPILSTFLLDAHDGRLFVTACDLEMAIRYEATAKVEKAGTCAVPAHLLKRLIVQLPSGTVTLASVDRRLDISAGDCKVTLTTMSPEHFPAICPRPDTQCEIPVEKLRVAFDLVKFAISTGKSRFALYGALMSVADGRLTMVATDNDRLSWVEMNSLPCGILQRALIPVAAIKASLQALPQVGGNVQIAVDADHIYLTCGPVSIQSRRLSGEFPDYRRVLPGGERSEWIVNREALAGALSRAREVADKMSRMIRLECGDCSITVSAYSADVGSFSERVPAVCVAPKAAVTIAFNVHYLLDWLGAVTSDDVAIRLTGAQDSGELAVPGEAWHRHIVMPVKVEPEA